MGMPAADLQNIEEVKVKVLQVDSDFDFVMISERFEESLILLAELLCWPLEYVTGLKHNVRKDILKVSCTTRKY